MHNEPLSEYLTMLNCISTIKSINTVKNTVRNIRFLAIDFVPFVSCPWIVLMFSSCLIFSLLISFPLSLLSSGLPAVFSYLSITLNYPSVKTFFLIFLIMEIQKTRRLFSGGSLSVLYYY